MELGLHNPPARGDTSRAGTNDDHLRIAAAGQVCSTRIRATGSFSMGSSLLTFRADGNRCYGGETARMRAASPGR